MVPRKYTQRRRAEQQEHTRRRIVEATMALHEKLGAARTTISAVAREAGVQRLTVYRHFPDETALLHACTAGWLELHPLPTAAAWDSSEDPIRSAFEAFFGYYRATDQMWSSSYRDVELVPALEEPMEEVEKFLDSVAEDLIGAMNLSPDAKPADAFAVVRHGLRYSTWKSLTAAGLDDHRAAGSLVRWVDCFRSPPPG